jgi:hypothetical protein
VTTGSGIVTAALGDNQQGTGGMFATVGTYLHTTNGTPSSSNRLYSDGNVESFSPPEEAAYDKQYNLALVMRPYGKTTLFMNGKRVDHTHITTTETQVYHTLGFFTIGSLVRFDEYPPYGSPPWFGYQDELLTWCDDRDPGDDWLREWSLNPWSIFTSPASFLPTETYVSFTPAAPTGGRRRYIFIN